MVFVDEVETPRSRHKHMRMSACRLEERTLVERLVFSACLLIGATSASCAQVTDLTVPPSFRAGASAKDDAAGAHPPGPSKKQTASHGKKANADPAPLKAVEPVPESASRAQEEDRLGLVTKWQSNNTSETSTRATSGLSEVNKNHDGESAGSGGQVGFKYKF